MHDSPVFPLGVSSGCIWVDLFLPQDLPQDLPRGNFQAALVASGRPIKCSSLPISTSLMAPSIQRA